MRVAVSPAGLAAAGASAADMVPGLEENVATRGLVLVR